jgi:hypothetical protein
MTPVGERIVSAVDTAYSAAPPEFTRMPASFRPPSYSARKYRLCKNLVLKNIAGIGFVSVFGAYLSGFADSSKLGESAVTGYPGPALVASRGKQEGFASDLGTLSDGHQYFCAYALGQLDYNGSRQLPPMNATFLSLGFEPVTATVVLRQVGTAPLSEVTYVDEGPPVDVQPTGLGYGLNAPPPVTVTAAHLELYLKNVSINGVPLNIGGSCRTSAPLSTPDNGIDPAALVLAGGMLPDDPEPKLGNPGQGAGALAGLATIPPFEDCVTPSGENLDSLLTATVSGPRNYLRVDESPVCAHVLAGTCVSPNPASTQPAQTPDYTVTHGGDFTASATSLSILGRISGQGQFVAITCNESRISGKFPDADGPPRGALSSIHWLSIDGCTDGNGGKYIVDSEQDAYLSGEYSFIYEAGVMQGYVDSMRFDITGPGNCSATLSGFDIAWWNSVSETLTMDPFQGFNSSPLVVSQSNCSELLNTTKANVYPAYTMTGIYTLGAGPVKPVITQMPVPK